MSCTLSFARDMATQKVTLVRDRLILCDRINLSWGLVVGEKQLCKNEFCLNEKPSGVQEAMAQHTVSPRCLLTHFDLPSHIVDKPVTPPRITDRPTTGVSAPNPPPHQGYHSSKFSLPSPPSGFPSSSFVPISIHTCWASYCL